MVQVLCRFIYGVFAELEPTLLRRENAPALNAITMTNCVNTAVGQSLYHAFIEYPEVTGKWLHSGWDDADNIILSGIGMAMEGEIASADFFGGRVRALRDNYVLIWKYAHSKLQTMEGKYTVAVNKGMLNIEDTWMSGMRCLYQDIQSGRFPSSVTHILGLLLLSWTIDSVDTVGPSSVHGAYVSQTFLSGVWEIATTDNTGIAADIANVLWPQWKKHGPKFSRAKPDHNSWDWIGLRDTSTTTITQEESYSTSNALLRRILQRQDIQESMLPFPNVLGSSLESSSLHFSPESAQDLPLKSLDMFHMDSQDWSATRYAFLPAIGFQSSHRMLETDEEQCCNIRNSRQLIMANTVDMFFAGSMILFYSSETRMLIIALQASEKLRQHSCPSAHLHQSSHPLPYLRIRSRP